MIVGFRSAVADLVAAGTLPVFATVPDDVAHVPCVVVGRARGTQGEAAVNETLSVELYVIARRQKADDPLAIDGELDADCDATYALLGATRGTHHNSWVLSVVAREPAVVEVAGLAYDAYSLTVSANHVTHYT